MFGFISAKKQEKEKEFYELIKAFREQFPATQGWSLNVYQKDDCVICKILRGRNILSQATVERSQYNSLVEAERDCITEALVRFGFVPMNA